MYIRPEYMDLCGGCAKETAEYIDGILFFEEGYYRVADEPEEDYDL